jgi:hypothetical protein
VLLGELWRNLLDGLKKVMNIILVEISSPNELRRQRTRLVLVAAVVVAVVMLASGGLFMRLAGALILCGGVGFILGWFSARR